MARRGGGDDHVLAIVLSGAAARGAFQAGALAALLPALERDGARPAIVLGTSAGAINAVLYGSMAHRGADGAAQGLVDLWSRMSHADVFAPIAVSGWGACLQFAFGALLGAGGGTTSLLDTAPLHRTAAEVLDLDRLHANVRTGRPAAVGVIATRVPSATAGTVVGTASGRSVLFLEGRAPTHDAGDPTRAQDAVPCRLGIEHVIASSAIPIAFPAQRIDDPTEAAGWYVDGGVRLNTPLRPAIAMGATRLVVVSATSTCYGPAPPADPGATVPDVADAGAQALHAVLADRMIEDLLAVRRTNRILAARGPGADRQSPLRRRDGSRYHPVELVTISPQPGELAALAADVARRTTSGLRAVRELDNWLVGRALRGAGDGSGNRELLSYLLFDETYFAESIELGRAAAVAALARGWES